MSFSAIDLTKLRVPSVVEKLDFEEIRMRLVERFAARCKEFDLDFYSFVESDPAIILLEAAAHEILLDRAQRNDEVRALLLAYAEDADLDHLAANVNIERHPGESDTALRRRVQLQPEALTNAGTEPAYIFHALEVEGVSDASAVSPAPGEVLITVLINRDEEQAHILNAVRARLYEEDIRQLTDKVTVEPARFVSFEIDARMSFYPGPAAEPVIREARARLDALLAELTRLDHDVARSAIMAALHIDGVQRIDLIEPRADVVISTSEAAQVSTISISEAEQRDV